nr:MAG TPA: hypothetical protein [Caudoviricetes sp.]
MDTIKPPLGYYTPSPEIWRGLSCPYFSHTFW